MTQETKLYIFKRKAANKARTALAIIAMAKQVVSLRLQPTAEQVEAAGGRTYRLR